jgi:hypothetical protein
MTTTNTRIAFAACQPSDDDWGVVVWGLGADEDEARADAARVLDDETDDDGNVTPASDAAARCEVLELSPASQAWVSSGGDAQRLWRDGDVVRAPGETYDHPTGFSDGENDGYSAALDAEFFADFDDEDNVEAVRELVGLNNWDEMLLNAMGSEWLEERTGLSRNSDKWSDWLREYNRGCDSGVRRRLAELEEDE